MLISGRLLPTSSFFFFSPSLSLPLSLNKIFFMVSIPDNLHVVHCQLFCLICIPEFRKEVGVTLLFIFKTIPTNNNSYDKNEMSKTLVLLKMDYTWADVIINLVFQCSHPLFLHTHNTRAKGEWMKERKGEKKIAKKYLYSKGFWIILKQSLTSPFSVVLREGMYFLSLLCMWVIFPICKNLLPTLCVCEIFFWLLCSYNAFFSLFRYQSIYLRTKGDSRICGMRWDTCTQERHATKEKCSESTWIF